MTLNEIVFNGNERMTLTRHVREGVDSFTYEFWIRSNKEIELDVESPLGESGVHGKRYVVAPIYHDGSDAGIGVAVGSNGIAVYEHARNHIPAVLVYAHDFSNWTHVAVVYREKRPQLYIDGVLVREGSRSLKEHVYPSVDLGGHEYGNFVGQLREFRLWKTARTEEEIRTLVNQDLSGNEPELLWYWNLQNKKITWDGTQANIQISVIVASNDRFPLNLFALKALELQTFPHEHMEIIFVSDGPPDNGVDFLTLISPTIPFKWIQCQSTVGRSAARNMGIQTASGSILLFIDAEMICPPHFVQEHVVNHLTRSKAVISGAMEMKRVFTVFRAGFNTDQISKAYTVYKGNADVLTILDRFFASDGTAVQILPTETILDTDFLSSHCYTELYFKEILEEFGYQFKDFHFPWMNFITNNVSVPRDLIEEVGGFDEQFQGFGWEDWDLGYRLYTHGAKFLHDPRLISYHQEHPISPQNVSQSRRNFKLFQRKYPYIDLRLFVLDMIPERVPFRDLNYFIDEYKILSNCQNDYPMIKECTFLLLEHVTDLFADGKAVSSIIDRVDLSNEQIVQLTNELSSLHATGQYPHVERMVRFLMAL